MRTRSIERRVARGLGTLAIATALASLAASGATAVSVETFDFSGAPIAGEDPDVLPEVTATFSWDDGAADQQLHITLTYDSGDLDAIGQTLSAVDFSVTGDAIFSTAGSSAMLGGDSEFVGAAATDASSLLGDDVSGHWAYASADGVHTVGSVGDAGLGDKDLLGTPSSLEPNAPNGTDFSIVPEGVCDASGCGDLKGGFQQDGVWISDEVEIWLAYEGTIGGITDVTPLFGTDAAPPVPEPGAALVFALGFGAVGYSLRRRTPRA